MIPGLGLLTSRLAGPIVTGGAVLLALALGIQSIRLADARGDLSEARDQVSTLTADLATCRHNTAGLRTSLDEQNAAVIALRTRTEAAEEAGRLARIEAERLQASARDRLAAARAVPVGETECETVDMRLTQFIFGGVR